MACQDWAATKAAYRFLDDDRVSEADTLIAIARLGGYVDRANDPPPENNVLWRGLSKLADIADGATLRIPCALTGK